MAMHAKGFNCAQCVACAAADLVSLDEDEVFRLVRRVTRDGYSMRETAEALGISLEACKKRVQRAKARLRERLK